MDDRVREEYNRILTASIIKHGALVRGDASIYGWMSEDDHDGGRWGSPRHSVTCGIAKTGRVEEDATWTEFAGTFAEQDDYKHGMEVHGVTCNCGKIKDRVFRWNASVGEAIKTVLVSLLEKQIGGPDVQGESVGGR